MCDDRCSISKTFGVVARPQYRFTRVLNGFSAALDSRAVALLERAPQVRGVYPIRAAYPASISRRRLSEEVGRLGLRSPLPAALGGFDGRGVTIALLDTGVDPAVPYLRGRVQAGIDVIGGDAGALAAAKPDDPTQIEWRGHPLFGHYLVDVDGVAPMPLSLVEKGVLKNFLLTRQPMRGFNASNGRARLPGRP